MARLDLSKTMILGADERDEYGSAEELLDEVLQRASDLGVTPYPKPSSAPPNLADIDVSELPNAVLGQYYVQYTAHAQYVFGELSKVEAAYRLATANLKRIEAKLKTRFYAAEVPKVEVSARVKDDAYRTKYEIELLRLNTWKELLEAHYKAFDKQAAALSRIIELRKLEFEQQVREGGISNTRKKDLARGKDFRRG